MPLQSPLSLHQQILYLKTQKYLKHIDCQERSPSHIRKVWSLLPSTSCSGECDCCSHSTDLSSRHQGQGCQRGRPGRHQKYGAICD